MRIHFSTYFKKFKSWLLKNKECISEKYNLEIHCICNILSDIAINRILKLTEVYIQA